MNKQNNNRQAISRSATGGLQQWEQEQFRPWQRAARAYLDEKQQQQAKLQQHAGGLQRIVAMLLELRERDAREAWNALGLEPQLESVAVDLAENRIALVPVQGERLVLSLSQMLDDLEAMLRAK